MNILHSITWMGVMNSSIGAQLDHPDIARIVYWISLGAESLTAVDTAIDRLKLWT